MCCILYIHISILLLKDITPTMEMFMFAPLLDLVDLRNPFVTDWCSRKARSGIKAKARSSSIDILEIQGFHPELKIQYACMHRYTLCTYINIISLASLCALPLVWGLPSFMGEKKNPIERLKSCQSQPLRQRHAHTHTPCYPILLHSICRDQLHCMATTQPSNTTTILPSLQYRSIHSTPPVPALCVSP